jgi:hypothetical protein
LISGAPSELGDTPLVHRNGERTITVHDAGEISEIDFPHDQIICRTTTTCKYFYDQEAVKEEAEYGENRGTYAGGNARIREANICSGGGTPSDKGMLRPAASKRNLRNVWNLGPAPFAEAHFATYPPKLVEPCIKAGTSEKGVCPKCGAPWCRVVKIERSFQSGSGRSGNMPAGKNGVAMQGGGATLDIRRGPCVDTETIGWQPLCSCDAGDPVPATVLDPFAGAGTTPLVADRLQRDAIGIDLNSGYMEMARARIERDAGMFASIAVARGS